MGVAQARPQQYTQGDPEVLVEEGDKYYPLEPQDLVAELVDKEIMVAPEYTLLE